MMPKYNAQSPLICYNANIIASQEGIVNRSNTQIVCPAGMCHVISPDPAFGNQIPKCRFVGSDLWLHLAHMSCLAIVTVLAGRGGVFPSGLAAQAHRMHMIQSGIGFCDICATVLAGVGITQKYVAFA